MPQAAPTRRRLQFSLGALLLLVTVFAVWLGWELHFVRERQAVVELAAECGGNAVTCAEMEALCEEQGATVYKPAVIPFWRHWLGDAAVEAFRVPSDAPKQLLDRVAQAFPESQVWQFDRDSPLDPRLFKLLRRVERDRGDLDRIDARLGLRPLINGDD